MASLNGVSSHDASIYDRKTANAHKSSNITGINADEYLKKKQQHAAINNIGNMLNGSVQPNACGW